MVGFLDQLFGSGMAGLWQVAQQYLPRCEVCGESAMFRCLECGSAVCHRHAFVSPEPIQIVCRPCVAKVFTWAGAHAPVRSPEEEWPYAEPPWEVLGIVEEASEDEIKGAYRRMSMQCHPDRGGSPEAQARVNAAYTIMLVKARRKVA